MRTTVHLPDELLKQAKQKAASQGRTLTSLIEQGLRSVVNGSVEPKRRKRVHLPVSSVSDGLLPGVGLASHSHLQPLLDDDVIRQAGLVKLK